jgi:hypothetical protein
MNNGFITLHRKILEWEWYDDLNTARLFIHCLLKANHKDGKWRGIIIKRGSFLTSTNTLSKETKLSTSQIRTAIKKLKSTNEITSQSQAQYSVITMLEYDRYQTNDKLNDKPMTNQSQTNDKPMTTNNNENNENNENNKPKKEKIPYQHIVDLYNDILTDLPNVFELTPKRKTGIKKLYNFKKEHKDISWWRDYFTFITKSNFLMGRVEMSGNHENWKCDFDFIININKFVNIIEGKYK